MNQDKMYILNINAVPNAKTNLFYFLKSDYIIPNGKSPSKATVDDKTKLVKLKNSPLNFKFY